MKMTHSLAIAWLAASVGILASAQEQAPGRGGRGPAQTWWVNKTAGGVYKPPMRPLWKLSDLKQMHAGQDTWQEQIILDPEQDATYNSGAPEANASRCPTWTVMPCSLPSKRPLTSVPFLLVKVVVRQP